MVKLYNFGKSGQAMLSYSYLILKLGQARAYTTIVVPVDLIENAPKNILKQKLMHFIPSI